MNYFEGHAIEGSDAPSLSISAQPPMRWTPPSSIGARASYLDFLSFGHGRHEVARGTRSAPSGVYIHSQQRLHAVQVHVPDLLLVYAPNLLRDKSWLSTLGVLMRDPLTDAFFVARGKRSMKVRHVCSGSRTNCSRSLWVTRRRTSPQLIMKWHPRCIANLRVQKITIRACNPIA